jgi:abortive infection bacteriophage resistance protein
MRYQKPPLSFGAQADLILGRGLVGDRNALVARLRSVNYYRLSAYWYTFRDVQAGDDRLLPGTTLDTVWRRYVFDRHLRLQVMDAVERIEVALRTEIVNAFTLVHGPFGHLNRANLPGLSPEDHRFLMDRVHAEQGKSREDFVRHYQDKYTSETELPLWMAVELMTFGTMYTLFRGLPSRTKKDVARTYGLHAPVLASWLRMLNLVRNICAHHARLWNREFDAKPLIPETKHDPNWHEPVTIGPDRMFGVLSVLYYLLKQVAPQSAWKTRFKQLLADYPDVPIRFMGLPDNWDLSPIWSGGGDEMEVAG